MPKRSDEITEKKATTKGDATEPVMVEEPVKMITRSDPIFTAVWKTISGD